MADPIDEWDKFRIKQSLPGTTVDTTDADPWSKFRKDKPVEKPSEGIASDIWNNPTIKGLTWRGDKDNLLKQGSGFGTSAVKGIPILGNTAPQNKYQDQYEEEHPILNAIGRGVGAIGATLPLSAAVAARSGAGIGSQMFNQGMLGGTLNSGDRLAKDGSATSPEDLISAMALGGIGGAAGPVLSKAISPGTYIKPTPPRVPGPDPSLTPYQQLVLKTRPTDRAIKPPSNTPDQLRLSEIQKAAALKAKAAQDPKIPRPGETPPWLANVTSHATDMVTHGMLGGILGHDLGSLPMGIALGVASPYVKDVLQKYGPGYATNAAAQQPAIKAMLSAIMMHQGDNLSSWNGEGQ